MTTASTSYKITPGLPESTNLLGDDIWTKKGTQLSAEIDPHSKTITLRKTFGRNPAYASFPATYEATQERIARITPQELLRLQNQTPTFNIRTPMPGQSKIIFDTSDLMALMDFVKNGSITHAPAPISEAKIIVSTSANTVSTTA